VEADAKVAAIAKRAVDDVAQEWASKATEALQELSVALRSQAPDRPLIERLATKAGEIIGVSALQAVVTTAVTSALS
jgi:hypothetical protein